jgi:hypothetical protein
MGYRRPGVVFQTGVANAGLLPGVRGALASAGVTPAVDLSVPGDATSYASVVERVIATKPDVLISEADAQTEATFLSQYKQLNNGVVPPLITGSDNFIPAFYTAIKKVLGSNYVTHDITLVGYYAVPTSPAFKAFQAGLVGSAAKKDAAAVQGNGLLASTYDGMVVMALAIDAAKSTAGPVFNKYISQVTSARPGAVVVHTYAEGVGALKAGKQISYVGTGGPISFNRYHNSAGSFSASAFTSAGSSRLLGTFSGQRVITAIG